MCLAPDSRSGLDENTQGCTINTKCKRGLGYCIYAQIRNNEVTLQILNKLFHFAKPQLSLPVHDKTPLCMHKTLNVRVITTACKPCQRATRYNATDG